MKLQNDYDTLVIVGAWNRAIFTPDWVGRYVFPGEEMGIELPLDNLDASPRYSSNGLAINIINQKLVFNINQPTQERFQQVGSKAIFVCRALAHTPIMCFGINHFFECSKQEIEDSNIFDFTNFGLLQDRGYELQSMRNQQSLKFEHHILNVIWTLQGDKVSLEFNNHYEVKDVEAFISIFDESLLYNRLDNSINYIKNIYGLSVEQ